MATPTPTPTPTSSSVALQHVNLSGFHAALQALTSSSSVDTQAELGSFVKAHFPNDFDTTNPLFPIPCAPPLIQDHLVPVPPNVLN